SPHINCCTAAKHAGAVFYVAIRETNAETPARNPAIDATKLATELKIWHIPDAKVEDDLFGERYRFALKQAEFNRRMDNNPLTRQEWEDAQKEIAMKEARLCWPTSKVTSQGPPVSHSSSIGPSYTPQSVLTKRKFSSEDPSTPSFRPRSNTEHHEYAEFRDWKRQKAMTAEAK
ncbi:hypothetical protein KC336_g22914, partial [Hortaea werneckii]